MTRHPFRWQGLAFGLFFLAIVGNWAVWEQDLLTTRQLSITVSGVLICLGLLGVAATFWQARSVSTAPQTTAPQTTAPQTAQAATQPEGTHHEQADPQ